MMSGIYGDRACYTPGLLAAMQIGSAKNVTLDNFKGVVSDIAQSRHTHFDIAVRYFAGKELSKDAFWAWKSSNFSKL